MTLGTTPNYGTTFRTATHTADDILAAQRLTRQIDVAAEFDPRFNFSYDVAPTQTVISRFDTVGAGGAPSRILVEQPRDALGRFLPKAGGEVRPGYLAEQATFDAVLRKPGWDVIRDPVSVRDATGQLRVYDGAAISPSGRYIGLETKSGTGRLTPAQRAFDARLNANKTNTVQGVGQSSQFEIQRVIEVRR